MTAPVSGLSKPVSRLKNVVFPAPFGPISAVIASALDLEVVDGHGPDAAERAGDVVGDEDRVGFGDAGCRLDAVERRGGRVVPRLFTQRGSAAATGRAAEDDRQRVTVRTSMAISRLSPKMPCGRNTISAMSSRPTRMKRTWPICTASMRLSGM